MTKQDDISAMMQEMGQRARGAYGAMAQASTQAKNTALLEAAKAIRSHVEMIKAANAKDIAFGKEKGLDDAMIDRLALDDKRIEAMAAGLEVVARIDDPVDKVLEEWQRPNGLTLQKVTVPLGVIGIIYESRPNVTADAAGLAMKSGNAIILRGGSESLHSSGAIAQCMHEGLKKAGLPEDAVQLVPTRDREAVGEMLSMVGVIDVIIPRGGKSLTARVQEHSRVPTLLHLDGNCHVYVHEKADADMAVSLVHNAKMRRVGICGAAESLLIDASVAPALLPKIANKLIDSGCELRGDDASRAIDTRIKTATEEDWGTEYLAAIMSVKIVSGVEEAITHINRYGSHHSDAIVTNDDKAARQFLRGVDSANVMHNASTQFADGGEFGFGAEIGIATGRLHARGPVGAQHLTTYKYVISGNGNVRP